MLQRASQHASGFNPRPAQSSGATVLRRIGVADSTVSIRAPLSRAGRPARRRVRSTSAVFQSAPRSVERGDPTTAAHATDASGVSIRAPLSRAGRLRVRAGCSADPVSIRAPLSRAGRPQPSAIVSAMRLVSIRAPLSRAGRLVRTSASRNGTLVSIRAPLSRAGRRSRRGESAHSRSVSIRAPLSRAGRLRADQLTKSSGMGFNPRPAQSSGATLSSCLVDRGRCAFQSAPRSVERGDLPAHAYRVVTLRVSIRAPLSRAGRPGTTITCVDVRSFNPRPAQSSGATCRSATSDVATDVVVSIRAPLSRAGRPWSECAWHADRCGFNPRPAQSSGATTLASTTRSDATSFQSAPRSVERGDVHRRR